MPGPIVKQSNAMFEHNEQVCDAYDAETTKDSEGSNNSLSIIDCREVLALLKPC